MRCRDTKRDLEIEKQRQRQKWSKRHRITYRHTDIWREADTTIDPDPLTLYLNTGYTQVLLTFEAIIF